MTIIHYDPERVADIGVTLDMRRPNIEALDVFAQHLGDSEEGVELVADLATGVGKTFIAGGLLDYLWESGVRNVVIVTPGTTIQSKTIANLTPGHPKYIRGLRCRPMVITLDDVERGTVAAALDDPDVFKVFVLTVQSLLRPNTGDGRRAHRPHETLGVSLTDHLRQAGDLVVIADEHHVYFSGGAKRFQEAIADLRPQALLGLTATPHESTEARVVYRYTLAEAIADGYVKIPVLVARPDGAKDIRTQLADGVALLEAKTQAMQAYCRRTRRDPVNPMMFVVAQTIDDARQISDVLAGPDFLGDPGKVLLVTSEEPDKALEALDRLEDTACPIRAVVSVSMLKEGWDVKNIYVIASVRTMESELLTEQVLGRGLRLPFGTRTGVPMLDTVEVLSHHAFSELLEQSSVLLQQTLGERAAEAAAVVDPTPGVNVPPVPVTEIPATGTGEVSTVVITLPGPTPAATDPNQLGLFGGETGPDTAGDAGADGGDGGSTHEGLRISTIEARLDDAAAATAALSTTVHPRTPGDIRLPLLIPRVTERIEREGFSLAQVNLLDVEGLGRQFARDERSSLTRKALDAQRNDDGTIAIDIHDEADNVFASQPTLPFDSIGPDLAGKLLRSNAVAATASELQAAKAVAEAFLRGADVTPQTPWRAEHGRLATARLLEWIGELRNATPARVVPDVHQVPWPEPAERIHTVPSADRHLITSASQFQKGHPYRGWERGVYPINSFDAFSTEFRLATLFETSPGIKAWVRVDESVPLRISYRAAAAQREYEPDFIVIDDDGMCWIVEGKADSEMTNPVVLAKRDAARTWITRVNAAGNVTTRWGYILASESVIAAAANWRALCTAAQTFRS